MTIYWRSVAMAVWNHAGIRVSKSQAIAMAKQLNAQRTLR